MSAFQITERDSHINSLTPMMENHPLALSFLDPLTPEEDVQVVLVNENFSVT